MPPARLKLVPSSPEATTEIVPGDQPIVIGRDPLSGVVDDQVDQASSDPVIIHRIPSSLRWIRTRNVYSPACRITVGDFQISEIRVLAKDLQDSTILCGEREQVSVYHRPFTESTSYRDRSTSGAG